MIPFAVLKQRPGLLVHLTFSILKFLITSHELKSYFLDWFFTLTFKNVFFRYTPSLECFLPAFLVFLKYIRIAFFKTLVALKQKSVCIWACRQVLGSILSFMTEDVMEGQCWVRASKQDPEHSGHTIVFLLSSNDSVSFAPMECFSILNFVSKRGYTPCGALMQTKWLRIIFREWTACFWEVHLVSWILWIAFLRRMKEPQRFWNRNTPSLSTFRGRHTDCSLFWLNNFHFFERWRVRAEWKKMEISLELSYLHT